MASDTCNQFLQIQAAHSLSYSTSQTRIRGKMCSSEPPTVLSLPLPPNQEATANRLPGSHCRVWNLSQPLPLYSSLVWILFWVQDVVHNEEYKEKQSLEFSGHIAFLKCTEYIWERVRWQKIEGLGFHPISATQKLSGFWQIINYNSLKISILQGCHED